MPQNGNTKDNSKVLVLLSYKLKYILCYGHNFLTLIMEG